MFQSDPNNYLVVNNEGSIEIRNHKKVNQKIDFDTLKINDLPNHIASKLWDTINSGSKTLDIKF